MQRVILIWIGIEFSDLYIGDKIQAYEYVESGFEELYSAYPLLYNDELVALAFEVDEGCCQISTDLAAKIDDASVSKLSLVYDLSSIYLFDGTE